MSDLRYWIALAQVPDIGPVTSRKLLSVIGSPERIFSAGINDLMSVNGINRERAENIRNFSSWDDIEKHATAAEKKGIDVLVFSDPSYPENLREVPDAPILIYMKGKCLPDDRYALAVVGSRKNTEYGNSVTQKISGRLASAGFTIVSGMARGIDTLAHKSALSAGGRTIAVLGSGPDICYPSENRRLMEKIISSGCAISEFPPGTLPHRENFPRRNRLISGLSLGVLVVEAAADSGSLITAGIALEQNREVFAVPGNITSENAAGTNMLIKQGAKIAVTAEDIIEELAPMLRGFIRAENKKTYDITEEEKSVCCMLTGEPRHIDMLTRESGMPVHKVLNILLGLELKGIVRQSEGKRYFLS